MARYRKLNRIAVSAGVFALVVGPALPAGALVVRDDVGVGGSEDGASGTEWDGVVQLYRWDPSGVIRFNCTGSLINPRTVISAAHCFNALPSTAYGTNRAGGETTMIVAYGPDTFDGLFNWLNTGSVQLDGRNGVAFSSQVIIHPDADDAFGSRLAFPGADVALVALSNPLANSPSYSLLFSPVPVGTHVTQIAYGGHGVGTTGDVGIDGKRQIGENIIGLIGSQNDFLRGTFGRSDAGIFAGPSGDQSLYFIDFDNPNRTGDECARQTSGDILCTDASGSVSLSGTSLAPSLSIDYFGGDALPGEAGTAGGDSGSAIFVDQLGASPLIAGVLSGGFNFTTPVGNGYGDVAYYNPLFNFYSFINEANPYKYVSAISGDGNWSDAGHWIQRLDPGYFSLDVNGNLVNRLPSVPEPGAAATGPREGSIYDVDINDVVPVSSASAGTEGESAGTVNEDQTSRVTPVIATATGLVAITEDAFPAGVPQLVTFGVGNADFGLASGAGAAGFVPNNGRNTAAYLNYFDVTLNAAGTTTADIDVVIDRLTLDDPGAALKISNGVQFIALVDTQIASGLLDVEGVFASRDILNGGRVTGAGGTIVTETFFNAGVLNAGAGGLTIEGDLVLTSAGALLYSGDVLNVNGNLSIDGGVAFDGAAFGQSGTLLSHTGTRIGQFNGELPGVLRADFTYAANSIDFAISAADYRTEFDASATDYTRNLGALLDALRGTDYAGKTGLYAPLDVLSGAELTAGLGTLVPGGAVAQQGVTLARAETLELQLGARIDMIRAGRADGASYLGSDYGTRAQSGFGGLAKQMSDAARAQPSGYETATGWGSFVSLTYYQGDQNSVIGSPAREIDGTSLTIGLDRDISAGGRIGVFASYSDTNSDLAAASANSRGYLIGGYGAKQTSLADLSAYAGIGRRDIETARAGLGGSAIRGSTHADEIIAGLAAQRMNTFGGNGFGFEPVVQLDYIKYDIEAYSETGGPSAVVVAAQDASSLQVSVGADVHLYNVADDAARWRPQIGARFVYDLEGERAGAIISLPGQIGPGAARLQGNARDRTWASAHLGLDYVASERFSGGIFAESTLGRDDLDYQSIGGRVKLTF